MKETLKIYRSIKMTTTILPTLAIGICNSAEQQVIQPGLNPVGIYHNMQWTTQLHHLNKINIIMMYYHRI